MAGTWPLLGRDDELARVGAHLDRTRDGGVVLVGPAGVGKTRLASECMHLASERGFATTRVTASRAARTIPFGALAPLLPPGAEAMEQGLSALRQVTLALADHAGGRPLMVVVDDAHSLDDASAVLIEQLAASHTAFLVVTLRTGETPPEPITTLWKDHGLDRIAIEPLSRELTDEFVATMLGDDVEQVTLSELWDKTQGNPMFLREMVMGAVEDGALVCERGRWHAQGELAPSDRLSELVGVRLNGLDADALRALELVAFGEPLGYELLGALGDADAVEVLERKGLVALLQNGRRSELRLAHPMYGEVLRVRTPAVRTRSINRRLAETVEGTGARRREDALRVSQWRLDGGGVPPMPLLLAGAAQALFANEYDIAHRLARTAFELEPTFHSGLLLLQIQYNLDRTAESIALVDLLRTMDLTDREQAGLAVMQSTSQFWKSGDLAGARRVMDEAIASLSDSMERDWLVSFQGLVDVQAGDPHRGLDRLAPLLQSDNPRTVVRASLGAALGLGIVGRCLDAVDIADRAFGMRERLGMDVTLFEAGLLLVAKSVALNEAGRITEARELGALTHSLAVDTNDVSSDGFCSVGMARICITAGRLREAADWATRAIDAFRQYGHPGPLRWAHGYLALASAMLGELRDATDALDDLDVQPPHPAGMLDIDIDRARAWTAFAGGHPSDAKAALHEAAARMRATDQPGFEASALFDLARLGEAKAVTDRLNEIAAAAQGELHAAMAAGAAAWASGAPDELAAASTTFERLGATLFAAELASTASDAFRRDGDKRRATEHARRAEELVDAIGGARTPALVRVDALVPLTQRERDVAILAAQGLASKVIAERLFMSSRTVDNHLARIYAKLGVTGRTELADALADDRAPA